MTKISILHGVNKLIDSSLGLKNVGKPPQYKHKESCKNLKYLNATVLPVLVGEIYEKIQNNWENSKHYKSDENWRLIPQRRISKNNDSPEVRLERDIVNIPDTIWPEVENWFNQVPVASGLVDRQADGSRRIDLVHKCNDNAYEFIELKVASNTPLYAAMEILQYGVLYLFARAHPKAKESFTNKTDLLQAKSINLEVLAPPSYYEGYNFAWLEEHIDRGLAEFLSKTSLELEMKFSFKQLHLIPRRSSPWISKGMNRTGKAAN